MIYICAYRDWGIEVFNKLKGIYDLVLIEKPHQLTHLSNMFHENDTIFFLGWSWIVENEIIDKYNCICLHPSPLPKYRGGSPIQNQIINKEQVSAVSFFKMNDKLDQGEILYQAPFSLKGELDEIFSRIIELGTFGIHHIIASNPKGTKQDESEATYCKRRKQEESEITIDEIMSKSAHELYDKVRMLNDPYPNAFIKCGDGNKLFITKTYYDDSTR